MHHDKELSAYISEILAIQNTFYSDSNIRITAVNVLKHAKILGVCKDAI